MSTDQRRRLGEFLHCKYFLEPPRKSEDNNRGLGRRLQGCVTTAASWMKPRVSTPTEKKGFPGNSGVKNLPANAAEQEMATHSNILPWEIPWTEEPGGLQSMGSPKSWTWL